MKNQSVNKEIIFLYVVPVILVAVLFVAAFLPQEMKEREDNLRQDLTRTAYILAYNDDIEEALIRGRFSANLHDRLDGVLARAKDTIDFLAIVDKHGKIYRHPCPTQMGQYLDDADLVDALAGKNSSYMVAKKIGSEVQLRAIRTIRDDRGNVIGAIIVGNSTGELERHKREVIWVAVGLTGTSLLVGLLLACGITGTFRRALLGHDPMTFAEMYFRREEILDRLNEGIFVAGDDGKILYKNAAAKKYIPGEILQKNSPFFFDVNRCKTKNEVVLPKMFVLGERSFLANMIPLQLGAVLVILRNRTDFVELSEQLTGLNHIIDALRANTHEYRNKLHILFGLLQVGEIERAKEFLGEETKSESDKNILRKIEEKTVAALILGKANRAAELGIEFILRRDSRLKEKNSFVSPKELVVIIGNLIENSFEAMMNPDAPRTVELYIFADECGITLMIDDTGCGMSEDEIQKVLSGDYTTKGSGHGYGMKLIREIVDRREGFLQIESEPGIGTSVALNFSRLKGL